MFRIAVFTCCLVLSGLLVSNRSAAAIGSDQDGRTAKEIANDLRKRMARFRGGGTNEIESAIVKLKSMRAGEELLPLIKDGHFGEMVAWALSECGRGPRYAEALIEFAENHRGPSKAAACLWVAGASCPEARKWLASRESAAGAMGDREKTVLRAALLRAGDAGVQKRILSDLRSKDAATCAHALALVGESRRIDLLGHLARLCDDPRELETPIKSKFGGTSRKVAVKTRWGDGFKMETEFPTLGTVGEAAIEAANRAVFTTAPQFVSWRDPEKFGRFGSGTDAARLLRAYVKCDRDATDAGAVCAGAAIEAIYQGWRDRTGALEPPKNRICDVKFEAGTWTITYELIESGERQTARVSKAGKVLAAK